MTTNRVGSFEIRSIVLPAYPVDRLHGKSSTLDKQMTTIINHQINNHMRVHALVMYIMFDEKPTIL